MKTKKPSLNKTYILSLYMYSTKIPISQVMKYYSHTSKIINFSNLTLSYKKYLKAEENLLKRTIPERANILEIGAGHGRIIDTLNNGKRKITGIEIVNLPFLEKKYKKDENIRILGVDAHKLPFNDKSFDVCLIMYNTLGLMHNPLKVLKECKRITRKNGQIIISTYTMDEKYALQERIKCFTKIGHKIMKVYGLDIDINDGVASHYFTKRELEHLFKNARLKPIYHPATKLGCIWIVKI